VDRSEIPANSRMLAAGSHVLAAGSRALAAGSHVLAVGLHILAAGSRALAADCCTESEFGCSIGWSACQVSSVTDTDTEGL